MSVFFCLCSVCPDDVAAGWLLLLFTFTLALALLLWLLLLLLFPVSFVVDNLLM